LKSSPRREYLPETFGNALSQGADPSYVAQLFVHSRKLPLRFYLDAGSLELDRDGDGSSILVTNRVKSVQ
jgi:enterochelin esterase family protein